MRILTSSTALPTIDLLNSVHQFPCPFVYKVIGINGTEFLLDVVAVFLRESPGFDVQRQISQKMSSGGKYLSLSVTVDAPDALKVLKIYDRLTQVKNLKGLM